MASKTLMNSGCCLIQLDVDDHLTTIIEEEVSHASIELLVYFIQYCYFQIFMSSQRNS